MSSGFGFEPVAFLTSAGAPTQHLQEKLRNLASSRGLDHPHVLRLSDGWTPFGRDGQIRSSQRFEQRALSPFIRAWSSLWLTATFGDRHTLLTAQAGSMSTENLAAEIDQADILLLPGGNTFLLARGIARHRAMLRERILAGRILAIGESAGSIVMGNSLRPALIHPADSLPANAPINSGLKLVDAPIVVHGAGRRTEFNVPGVGHRAVERIMDKFVDSSQADIADFAAEFPDALVLSDASALIIGSDGNHMNVPETFSPIALPELSLGSAAPSPRAS